MPSVSQVLAKAAGEIGYSRWTDPQSGTKYGRWYASKVGISYYGESGVPYCAMFVSWVLCQCGFDFTYAYCPYILRDLSSRAVGKAQAQPGDVVLFDWGGDGVPDHVGFVEANRGAYLQTIEGNTSPGTGGSQSNGGGVYRRTRSLSTVRAVIRLPLSGSTGSVASGFGDESWMGPLGVAEWQRQRGTTADGIPSGQSLSNRRNVLVRFEGVAIGPGGSDLVRSIQRLYGVTADGDFGPATCRAHQAWLRRRGHYSDAIDGCFGPNTARATFAALKARAYS